MAFKVFLLASAVLLGTHCTLPAPAHRASTLAWHARPISYAKPRLWNQQHLTWRVETQLHAPVHGLAKGDLCHEIDKCFKSWEPAGVFTFSQAREGERADITISFRPPPGRFWDGQLGTMGHAAFPWSPNRGCIYLDPSEWWSTADFSFLGDRITEWLPHEIGHVLGLQHARTDHDLMCAVGPYPMPDEQNFARLRHLYAPTTPVIAWSNLSTAARKAPRLMEIAQATPATVRRVASPL